MGRIKDLLTIVYGGGDQAVDAAEQLASMNRWTRCTEREPEIVGETLSEVVLAWRPGEEWPSPAYVVLESGKRVWKWKHDGRPTHWIPMPEVPE